MNFDDVKPGFAYKDIDLTITTALQAERLDCCQIDPDIYGGFVDFTHFCNEAILAATKSGLSINGNVHTTDRIVANARIPLDQSLVMSGSVTKMEPVARGTLITSEFTFTLPDGSVPLKTIRSSTRLNPDGAKTPGISTPVRAEPDLSQYWTVATCAFAPDRVTRYSSEGRNAIHYDPEVARQFGFRAPIAGGLMGVRSLMASICQSDGPPATVDVAIRFRRPMFWDESLDVMHRTNADGVVTHMALINGAGKIAVEADVAGLV